MQMSRKDILALAVRLVIQQIEAGNLVSASAKLAASEYNLDNHEQFRLGLIAAEYANLRAGV